LQSAVSVEADNRPWSLSPRATTGSGYGKLPVLIGGTNATTIVA
jgi:hypothetical protein